jgi:hypothetical protein
MKKRRNLANVCQLLILGLGLVLLSGGANAQLTNGGFEFGSGLYTNTANPSQITTGALGWVQFDHCFRTSTNAPQGLAQSGSSITARNGSGYSLQCYGPWGGWGASGAYQTVTNGVAAGQTWILSGYGLNWSGDPMSNTTVLAQGFAIIQLKFQNAAGADLWSMDGPHLDPRSNNVPVDTWISCSVTGTAPAGTAKVLAYAMHVGFGANAGSIFWDDLTLVSTSVATPTNYCYATIAGGNQVCWPTTAGRSYQPQYSGSPSGPVWTNLGGEVAGDGNTNCVCDAVGPWKKNSYRVLELQ